MQRVEPFVNLQIKAAAVVAGANFLRASCWILCLKFKSHLSRSPRQFSTSSFSPAARRVKINHPPQERVRK
jgi:hypothetical protein